MSTMLMATPEGKTRVEWDPADEAAVSEVKETFEKAVGAGTAFAFKSTPAGKEQIKEFDPTAEEIFVTPRMVGG